MYFFPIYKEEIPMSQAISFLKLRTKFDPILDFNVFKDDGQEFFEDDFKNYIENTSIEDLLSYNVINRSNFLLNLIKEEGKKDNIIDVLFTKIESLNPDEIPFLLPGEYIGNKISTSFDKLLENANQLLIQRFLNILCSTNSIIYAPVILKNFNTLKDNYQMRPFLDSNLAFYKVIDCYNDRRANSET